MIPIPLVSNSPLIGMSWMMATSDRMAGHEPAASGAVPVDGPLREVGRNDHPACHRDRRGDHAGRRRADGEPREPPRGCGVQPEPPAQWRAAGRDAAATELPW